MSETRRTKALSVDEKGHGEVTLIAYEKDGTFFPEISDYLQSQS